MSELINDEIPVNEEFELRRSPRHLIKIQDADVAWLAMISDEELEQFDNGTLQLYWDREYRWCLVTKYQRQLLMEKNRKYLNDFDKHLYAYGQRSWEDWTSIKVLNVPGRQFKEVRRQSRTK